MGTTASGYSRGRFDGLLRFSRRLIRWMALVRLLP